MKNRNNWKGNNLHYQKMKIFSNHFHEHYVIGFVEDGERCLSCRNKDYTIGQGSIISPEKVAGNAYRKIMKEGWSY